MPGALALGAAIVLAGCSSSSGSPTTTGSNSTSSTSGGSGQSIPAGATINVGAISTLTGALASDFGGLSPGIKAYFSYINSSGGIDGHKLVLAYNLDDGGNPTQFNQLTHTVIDQDHAFAVFTASAFFSPNYYVSTGTPTYGYNVTGNWSSCTGAPLVCSTPTGWPNLYGAGGNSVQYYPGGVPAYAFWLKQTHSKAAAIISYSPSIPSSYQACASAASGLKSAGYNIAYEDLGAQYAGSFNSAVQNMQQNGVGAVISCMAETDNVTLARDIQQYGANIKQLWLNGYDRSLLDQYKSLMQGVYLGVSGTVPYEAAEPKFGNTYPGMKLYIQQMTKYQPSFTYNGVALQGWQSAVLFKEGIQKALAAGLPLTQANLVSETNKITSDTGGGVSTVTNWSTAHTTVTYPLCSALVQVQNGQFVVVFGKGLQVFNCFTADAKNPTPVPGEPGTPGT
ncbi:MAG: ABC transporter substrate-binding protein [Acidimicrobiales bacterium]